MKLKDWLTERGMPQAEFARRVGVNRTTLYQWLNGIAHPNYKNYLKIKEITNGQVKYEEIFQT